MSVSPNKMIHIHGEGLINFSKTWNSPKSDGSLERNFGKGVPLPKWPKNFFIKVFKRSLIEVFFSAEPSLF